MFEIKRLQLRKSTNLCGWRRMISTACALASLQAVTVLNPSPTAAQAAEPCTINESIFDCGDTRAEIASNLAHRRTLLLLQAYIVAPSNFPSREARERFRVSLEKQRKAAQRYANHQFRLYRRGRISAESYESTRQQFNAGMKAYRAGVTLYRHDIWEGRNE